MATNGDGGTASGSAAAPTPTPTTPTTTVPLATPPGMAGNTPAAEQAVPLTPPDPMQGPHDPWNRGRASAGGAQTRAISESRLGAAENVVAGEVDIDTNTWR